MTQQQQSVGLLSLLQGAVLLTADCLGTGLLALPSDLNVVLGLTWGIFILILQLPLNLYAGTVLHKAATIVEARGDGDETTTEVENQESSKIVATSTGYKMGYDSINIVQEYEVDQQEEDHCNKDQLTFDFIGITQALFESKTAKRVVITIYYTNIFLVLGDYILVMSHAVVAMVGGNLCLPIAGLLASTLMFAVSQLRTMEKLGRTASFVSLAALLIVLLQCLAALKHIDQMEIPLPQSNIFSKFSGLAAIGFAVGSQKLFLNIRHEMRHRYESPKALGYSLIFYVTAYVVICIIAGPNPPSFLFDAIAPGFSRQLGGFLLWVHVVVSYAINSQAICSSMDRLLVQPRFPQTPSGKRWMGITLLTSVSAFLVANAIPFFSDLVALIGALTSIPLTLLLPILLYRKATSSTNIWIPDISWSYLVLVASVLFTIVGLIGAIVEIDMDW
eukprot:CAMPEP_0194249794 /NCGR_PEP_ID=MMETSP0158-20130606/21378_1 /TAXON_ID=33649 /ORGANISM="Thalassionema nitzschioides, Strain L26-B" /LENGTH=446 /DNA_ID=CAMNT_0038986393 /DNA_START=93 /DNA_END=1430 /DNA_ORIENTATION=+